MKIRTGYVSNSSSSSFVIATKKKLTKQSLLEAFQTPKDHPMHDIAEQICNLVVSRAKEPDIDELRQDADYGCKSSKKTLKLIDDGWIVRTGSFHTDDGGIDCLLCETGIKIKTEELVLESTGY